MKTPKLLLMFVFILCQQILLSQEIRIQGSVADSLSREPLPFATIQVVDQGNQMVFGAIADSLGIFELPNVQFSVGSMLVVSFIGYNKKEVPIVLQPRQTRVNLRQVLLVPDLAQLPEVVITGQRRVQDLIDRTVFRVDSLMLDKVISTADLLAKIPDISVNPLTYSVRIKGGENTLVLLNGINSGQIVDIRSIDQNDIDRIEVITSPSAAIDAQFDGVVNIVLKRQTYSGISGNADVWYMPGGQFFEGYGGLVFGGKKHRINISYYNAIKNFPWMVNLTRFNKNTGDSLILDMESERAKADIDHIVSASIDFYPSANVFFNVSSRTNFYKFDRVFDFSGRRVTSGVSNIISPYTRHNKSNFFSGNYTMFYKRTLGRDGHSLSANVNFHIMDSDNETGFFSEELSNTFEEKGSRTSLNAKIEYENQITPNLSFATGLQSFYEDYLGAMSEALIENDYYILRNNVYGNLLLRQLFGLEMNMGLRLERNEVHFKDDNFSKSAHNGLFPTLILSKQLNNSNRLRAEYRRSSFYPSAVQLSPYTVITDQNTTISGNPQLVPQTTNLFQISHTYRKGETLITSRVYHRFLRGIIARSASYDSNNNAHSTFQNMSNRGLLGINVSGSIILFGFLMIDPDFSLIYENDLRETVRRTNTTYSASLYTILGLPGGFGLGAFGTLTGKRLTVQGFNEPTHSLNFVFLMKRFYKQNLGLFVGLRDLARSEERSFTTDGIVEEYRSFNFNAYGLGFRLIYSFNRGREQRMRGIETNFDTTRTGP